MARSFWVFLGALLLCLPAWARGELIGSSGGELYGHAWVLGWVAEARARVIRDQVAEVFAALDVETIAPDFGCVLRGRDVVARHLELVLAVLDEVGADARAGVR